MRFPTPLRRAVGFLGLPLALAVAMALPAALHAAAATTPPSVASPGDKMIAAYFRDETVRVHSANFAGLKSLADWEAQRGRLRAELFEMMGLSPLPPRGDLQATVTGRIEHLEFTVEKLHYQSLPGLYVTANLYVPKVRTGPVPAILYVCGHGQVKENGVAYGAKTSYQHHGAWFARHGYVCLMIDTIELGELEGTHHGTHREGKWWWNARGYSPGGVEAWNAMRALDYLQSRPEVDGAKLGVTGRSGGGAYTWFTAALDERVKVAVPVAGITDLHNHVVDGRISGHCDCMFPVNTYRWDFAKLAALIAPRPLLFANTDKDTIFPLDGVMRVHGELAAIYQLYKATDKLGLLITEGPHKDTQDLQVPALRWFNRFLKNDETPVRLAAEKLFKPAELKVFPVGQLPTDQRTTVIHETFVPVAAPAVPATADAWAVQRDTWMRTLSEKCFAGWPQTAEPLALKRIGEVTVDRVRQTRFDFTSQESIRLPLRVTALAGATTPPARVILRIVDTAGWGGTASGITGALEPALRAQIERGEVTLIEFAPRGLGATASTLNEKDQTHQRRRYQLLGQTADGMRVWDIRRAVAAARSTELFGTAPLELHATGPQAINALYASLYDAPMAALDLTAPPASHRTGPDYLNVLRFLDVPQAAALAADRAPVRLHAANIEEWSWTRAAAKQLKWPAERLTW
jgi:dienelactone hydrolase